MIPVKIIVLLIIGTILALFFGPDVTCTIDANLSIDNREVDDNWVLRTGQWEGHMWYELVMKIDQSVLISSGGMECE